MANDKKCDVCGGFHEVSEELVRKNMMAYNIKQLHEYSVGGNIYDGTCFLTLYNEDENGVESDTVCIDLTQKDIRSLIKSLEMFLKPEEETVDDTN